MITVVIGHGRSPEGRGWGNRIDAADRVIRMWNWEWQAPTQDYGRRYDFGLIEAHKKTVEQWREHNRRTPSTGWVASLLMRYREMAAELPKGCVLVDQAKWLCQPIKVDQGRGETGEWQLTRGGVAACWAIDTAKSGDELVLVGFDVIRAGISMAADDAFSPAYQQSAGFWGIDGFKEGATKEGNHDYPAERKLITFLAARAAVTVEFAQDVWP